MSRRLLTTAAIAASAAVVGLAGPAMAAGPYTVSAGDTTTGTTAFEGTAGAISFASPNATVNCTAGTAAGDVTLGASADGAGIASIASSSFTSCTGPVGLSLKVEQSAPWRLNATGAPEGGVTAGTIDQVSAKVSSTGLIPCSFTVSGAVDGSFDENTQTLDVAPADGEGLTVADVSGCVGFVSNGQKATMTTSYKITTEAGALSIAQG